MKQQTAAAERQPINRLQILSLELIGRTPFRETNGQPIGVMSSPEHAGG